MSCRLFVFVSFPERVKVVPAMIITSVEGEGSDGDSVGHGCGILKKKKGGWEIKGKEKKKKKGENEFETAAFYGCLFI